MTKGRIRRVVFGVLFLIMLAIGPAAAFGRTPPGWAPEALRNWAFDVRLAVAPVIKKAQSVWYGSIGNDRAYLDKFGQNVEFRSEGIRIVGTLYEPISIDKRPGILLLHGSTPEGRRLGLYRILGERLAEEGYIVLSIDQRGYGDSDDPPKFDSYEDFDPVQDVKNAIAFLCSIEVVDSEMIFVIGHSGGADVAITEGIENSRVDKIVAIGPSRRVRERAGGEDASELAYFRRRDMRYMSLNEPIPEEFLLQRNVSLPLENHLDYFSKPGHKPLLLIDGELEDQADRLFLRSIADEIVEPKEYITLKNADHYADVADFGSLIIYDQEVIKALVDTIDKWFSSE